jgi:putative salt-induced outer membrane protein YdiY
MTLSSDLKERLETHHVPYRAFAECNFVGFLMAHRCHNHDCRKNAFSVACKWRHDAICVFRHDHCWGHSWPKRFSKSQIILARVFGTAIACPDGLNFCMTICARPGIRVAIAVTFVLASIHFRASFAHGQAAPAPQAAAPAPVWTGNLGAGLAVTNGNTDTRNFNLSFGVVRDPKKTSIFRANGLYLRGDSGDKLIANQMAFTLRDEISLSSRVFVFGQGNYTRDTFKGIRYLVSPTAGIGYKLINTDATLLGIDTGIGAVWEHDTGIPRTVTGAYNLGERFSHKISSTATINQSIASLWKTNNWSDSLHNFSVGLAASVTAHTELKIEFIDSFKNRPPLPGLKKNDTSLITAFVWKL